MLDDNKLANNLYKMQIRILEERYKDVPVDDDSPYARYLKGRIKELRGLLSAAEERIKRNENTTSSSTSNIE